MLKNIFILIFCAFFVFSCQETSNIGEDLLKDERLDLDYTRNFTIKAKNILSEDVIGYSNVVSSTGSTTTFSPITGLIGSLDDATFGKVKAILFTRVIYSNLAIPTFKNIKLDSAVLVLAYDTLGFYGDKNTSHHLIVEEIDEDYKDADTIFSSRKLAVKSKIVGEKTFVPAPKDSIKILAHADSTSLKLPAQIRVKLDQDWASSFLSNAIISEGPTSDQNNKLYEVLKGLSISSVPTNGNSILGLNLSSSSVGSGGLTKLYVYYKNEKGVKENYAFYLSTLLKYNHFEIDNASAPVNDFIDNESKADSLLFLQSMNGPSFYIEFPDLSLIKDKILNIAEVTFTVPDYLDLQNNIYDPVTQIIASKKENGKLTIIQDIVDLQSSGILALGFGGSIQGEKGKTRTYTINITKHLKSLLKDDTLDRKIYITALNRSERASRVVLYGPKHSKAPVKLKVVYTEK